MAIEFIELTEEELGNQSLDTRFMPVAQRGPYREHDTHKPCMSRRCGSPAYQTVRGIWYCGVHSNRVMNQLLIDRGVES